MAKRHAVSVEQKEAGLDDAAKRSLADTPLPPHVPAGFRRFAIGVGTSLTHNQKTYSASPDGWTDLSSGEDWYFPLIEAGVLREILNDEKQTN